MKQNGPPPPRNPTKNSLKREGAAQKEKSTWTFQQVHVENITAAGETKERAFLKMKPSD